MIKAVLVLDLLDRADRENWSVDQLKGELGIHDDMKTIYYLTDVDEFLEEYGGDRLRNIIERFVAELHSKLLVA